MEIITKPCSDDEYLYTKFHNVEPFVSESVIFSGYKKSFIRKACTR
jgi:hypothetical protein